MTEEEANAELERLQQSITLTLQEIDKNFSECNQIITSKILPEIDNYAQASQSIRDSSKSWRYFLESIDSTPPLSIISDHRSQSSGTNRPPIESAVDTPWQRHDVTKSISPGEGSIRSILQQDHLKIPSIGSSSPLSDIRNNDSSPRTISFRTSPGELLGTPIDEAVRILNQGARRYPSSGSPEERRKGKGKDKWDGWKSDETVDSERFTSFIERRNNRMKKSDALFPRSPTMEDMRPSWLRVDEALVSSPTVERVLDSRASDLRTKRTADYMDDVDEDDMMINEEKGIDSGGNKSMVSGSKSVDTVDTFMRFISKDNVSDHSVRAYQFENPFSRHEPNVTMVMGQSGEIPARFSLHYFPKEYQHPPLSTILTKVYNIFNDRPGMMLTAVDVWQCVNDDSYSNDDVALLIRTLANKMFLKRVGESDSWTIRR
ncbi:DASH complex subunit Ask1-domain-containing protein [Pilobolus umbonatus]|nr:DASH complex subunit Ask1-domain-containing protein [Pilobolus umbonatus]